MNGTADLGRVVVTGGAGFLGSHICERLRLERRGAAEEGLAGTCRRFREQMAETA